MTKELDLSSVEEYEKWVPLDLAVLGKKEIVRKKDGKKFQVLVCEHANGQEVSLFDWGLKTENGKFFVLKNHLASAIKQMNSKSL